MPAAELARSLTGLENALREFKPDLNAAAEAQRARAGAKSDLSEFEG